MSPPSNSGAERLRVLVVDDDEIVLAGLSATLESDGFDVVSSRSGYDAVDVLARGTSFALVITDLMMPGLSGIGVLERVRAVAPETPVVVLSGFPKRGLADEAIRKGADEFLVKPVDYNRLRRTLRSLLHFEEALPG